jgi:UDP-N-acetylglucosamine 2-epimerase (non-hydrolysing)
MKVITILGTRPEIVRLSCIIPALDSLCDHVIVHTGQNSDPLLSDVFFHELGIRQPNHYLGVESKSFGQQAGEILHRSEETFASEKPDRLLVLGDTNTGLSAIVAKRMAILVYHMEAGNRCFDDRVPEEVNRRIIDQTSDVLMPYTERSRQNLVREGFASNRIYVIGNPIQEVIQRYHVEIGKSQALNKLTLKAGEYFLVTMHRAENVEVEHRLRSLVKALDVVQKRFDIPVVCSLHPHTRKRMAQAGISLKNTHVRFLEPLGLFDFIHLEQNAFCVLTDSGTVQEECCIFHVPAVTIRDTTERPETLDCGSNILSGVEPDRILRCVNVACSKKGAWQVPTEYLVESVSSTVTRLLLGEKPSSL